MKTYRAQRRFAWANFPRVELLEAGRTVPMRVEPCGNSGPPPVLEDGWTAYYRWTFESAGVPCEIFAARSNEGLVRYESMFLRGADDLRAAVRMTAPGRRDFDLGGQTCRFAAATEPSVRGHDLALPDGATLTARYPSGWRRSVLDLQTKGDVPPAVVAFTALVLFVTGLGR